ncbi:DUF2061 domain-containing protein [Crenobacter intestini]|uniref:DUF2061 domain-containing protein n=1 Tax=Crenobacter intestini TaxID=2563443 RepID=A0A4T0UJ54_9NEIS|nr:DUF2061 domain-containing protein [Crenobacter intestini]
MTKTLTFAATHFTVAFGVAYLLTGSFAISGAMALAEPLTNTVTYHFHDKAWARLLARTPLRHVELAKTATFALCHFTVAFGLGWLLTGSVALAGLLALVEPVANTFAYFAHEKLWARRGGRSSALPA